MAVAHVATSTLVLMSPPSITTTLAQSCGLPHELSAAKEVGREARQWDIAGIVELREILDLTISDETNEVAFIVKQPCTRSGNTLFGLYVAHAKRLATAKKLVEAAYLADLSHHPRTARWTVRADFGVGVQLYDIDSTGQTYPLVINPDTIDWGGEVFIGYEIPHKAGILSYGWSPDGSSLWYSRRWLRPNARSGDDGVVFDGNSTVRDMLNSPNWTRDRELRYFDPVSRADRSLVAAATANVSGQWLLFARDTVTWHADSNSLEYSRSNSMANGEWNTTWWSVDIRSGESHLLRTENDGAPIAATQGNPRLSVTRIGQRNHLLEEIDSGRASHDYGPVGFQRVLRVAGHSKSGSGARAIVQVGHQTHDGLVLISKDRKLTELAADAHLGDCTFDAAGSFGACVRESLTLPPEVVVIFPDEGRLAVLARPNADYAAVGLRAEHSEWKNRYGHISDGYITYPRDFAHGRRYPTLVVTHGKDAKNRFAWQGFQWDFHVQVFADRGYLVLSVNEPQTSGLREAINEKAGTEKVQFSLGLDAVASMEAALGSLQREGVADLEMTGIAGYSRGGEVVGYAMSQSKMFKAGVEADGIFMAGRYWDSGFRHLTYRTRATYGGSPYDTDPRVIENYRRFHPTFRAQQFAGPLLSLRPSRTAIQALELPMFLAEAGIPAELVSFPGEGHNFWHPRHRVAAMERTLDWFDYWLLGKKDPNPIKYDQYMRWDAQARIWKARLSQAVTQAPAGEL